MKAGDVVFVPFPYMEKAVFKERPVVVLMKTGNRVVCAALTSHAQKLPWEVELKYWKEAGLQKPSKVKVDTLSTFSSSSKVYCLGRLHPSDFRRVWGAFEKIVDMSKTKMAV